MSVGRIYPNLVKIEQKYRGTVHEDLCNSCCCQRRNFTVKHFYVTFNIYILLRVRCSSKIQTQRVVAFPRQQLLPELAIMFCYKKISCLVYE